MTPKARPAGTHSAQPSPRRSAGRRPGTGPGRGGRADGPGRSPAPAPRPRDNGPAASAPGWSTTPAPSAVTQARRRCGPPDHQSRTPEARDRNPVPAIGMRSGPTRISPWTRPGWEKPTPPGPGGGPAGGQPGGLGGGLPFEVEADREALAPLVAPGVGRIVVADPEGFEARCSSARAASRRRARPTGRRPGPRDPARGSGTSWSRTATSRGVSRPVHHQATPWFGSSARRTNPPTAPSSAGEVDLPGVGPHGSGPGRPDVLVARLRHRHQTCPIAAAVRRSGRRYRESMAPAAALPPADAGPPRRRVRHRLQPDRARGENGVCRAVTPPPPPPPYHDHDHAGRLPIGRRAAVRPRQPDVGLRRLRRLRRRAGQGAVAARHAAVGPATATGSTRSSPPATTSTTSASRTYFEAHLKRPTGRCRTAGRPLWATLGNHDVMRGHGAEQLAFLGLPPLPYAKTLPGVRFLFLDGNRPGDAAQKQWLADQLADPAAAAVHGGRLPPAGVLLRAPRPDPDGDRDTGTRLLNSGRVSLVLTGHDHQYQRFLTAEGTTFIVTGGGGRETLPADPGLQRARDADRRGASTTSRASRSTPTGWPSAPSPPTARSSTRSTSPPR